MPCLVYPLFEQQKSNAVQQVINQPGAAIGNMAYVLYKL